MRTLSVIFLCLILFLFSCSTDPVLEGPESNEDLCLNALDTICNVSVEVGNCNSHSSYEIKLDFDLSVEIDSFWIVMHDDYFQGHYLTSGKHRLGNFSPKKLPISISNIYSFSQGQEYLQIYFRLEDGSIFSKKVTWPTPSCREQLSLDSTWLIDVIVENNIQKFYRDDNNRTTDFMLDQQYCDFIKVRSYDGMQFFYDEQEKLIRTYHYYDGGLENDGFYYYNLDGRLDSIRQVTAAGDKMGTMIYQQDSNNTCGPDRVQFISEDSREYNAYVDTFIYRSDCSYIVNRSYEDQTKNFSIEYEYDDKINPCSYRRSYRRADYRSVIPYPHNITKVTHRNADNEKTSYFESQFTYYENGYPKSEIKTNSSGTVVATSEFYYTIE